MGATSGQFELRLKKTGLPSGEIELRDLARIGEHLQDLATRVGRWVAGIDRVGRSTGEVEDAVGLRLVGIRGGSTVLVIERGPALDSLFDVPLEAAFDDRLWETLGAIGTDAPRDDTPLLVRESAVNLLDALKHAAPEVQLTREHDNARIAFRTAERDRRVWQIGSRTVEDQVITVSGIVTMVDLETHRFRLHDDVGNSIVLQGVDDSIEVRRLIGERADATGNPVRDAKGRLTGLQTTGVVESRLPQSWTTHARDDTWRELAQASQPDPDGAFEFSDEEWATFLAAIRGV